MNVAASDYGLDGAAANNAGPLNKAIDAVSAAGGGRVVIPPGNYRTGTIYLKDGVTLELTADAVLEGVADPEAYGEVEKNPLLAAPQGSYPRRTSALVIAEGVRSFAIRGKGMIRGIGNSPYHGGATSQEAFRPNLLSFKDCSDFTLQGISLYYSSFWTLHMLRCRKVTVDGVRIRTHMNRVNADGIDPDGCEDVTISNCSVHSADDPFTIKSTEGDACRRIRVENCEFKSTFGGVKIGTESMGAFEDIEIRDCRVLSSWIGLCLYMKDGGSYRNLSFSGLDISAKGPFGLLVDNTPRFFGESVPGDIRGLTFTDLAFSGPGRMLLAGYRDHPITDFKVERVTFRHSGKIRLSEAKKPNGCGLVRLDPDQENHASQPYFVLGSDLKDFTLEAIRIVDEEGAVPEGVGFLYLRDCQSGSVSLEGRLRRGAASHLLEDVTGISMKVNGEVLSETGEMKTLRGRTRSLPWIWTDLEVTNRNAYVGFQKEFNLSRGEQAILRLTAESRYVLWVNGKRLGIGPSRAWPSHWEYDRYDLTADCVEGTNTVSVLVLRYGEGTMQYIPESPGLAAAIEIKGEGEGDRRTLGANESWKVRIAAGFVSKAPRIALQMAFAERFDARLDPFWWQPGETDNGWTEAVRIPAPHARLRRRETALLDSEEWLPSRISECTAIQSTPCHWTINLRPYCCPDETLSAPMIYKGYLFTQIWSPKDQEIRFMRPHWYHQGPMFLNGEEIPRLPGGFARAAEWQHARLDGGWNRLLIPLPDYSPEEDGVNFGISLFPQFSMDVDTDEPVSWSAPGLKGGEDNGSAWAFIGPFAYTAEEATEARGRIHNFVVISPRQFAEGATAENCLRVVDRVRAVSAGPPLDAPEWFSRIGDLFKPVSETDIIDDDVFLQSLADKVVRPIARVDEAGKDGFPGGGLEIPVPEEGEDGVRFLVDFGNMVVGDHEFDIDAGEGTVIDMHNFEFIQRDGRKNYAEGMNNTFRYTCREGRQTYRTTVRRGFRYTWITVRNATRPVCFHGIRAHFVAYPQKQVGSFTCSDSQLNRIWGVGAHTLRCCSEDTFTDCPTYEQVYWVGDARNEALIDWVINADPRLWYRCLRLAGESLERSAITESHVPSSDRSILPAWTFLWMRSCREYLLYTGDFDGTRELFPFIERNFEGIRQYLNPDNLFEIHAWNMFDWAEMDTPDEGVVTHNNCFLVLALNECAELAEWLKEDEWAGIFRDQAARVKKAINTHLWDDAQEAYVDCIHKDGQRSTVFSQQTQAVALRAGVPVGSGRTNRCRDLVFSPPDHFVKSGSPFFQFFILEILAMDGCATELLDSIREHWGFMIEEGASTFWEMWSLRTGRLTRSHCHGWSAAPTYFLSSEVLGIQPMEPGFTRIRFTPRMGDLTRADGIFPTPHGLIKVRLTVSGDRLIGEIDLPDGVEIGESSGVDIVHGSLSR